MHVLILPSWYFPFDSQEIAGRMFHQLAGGLRNHNIDARIFYPHYTAGGPIFKRVHKTVEGGVPTWRVLQFFPPKLNRLLLEWWRRKCVIDIRRYIQEQGAPDVIHAHSYMAAYIASGFRESDGIPFVYTERLSSFITASIPKKHELILKEVYRTADIVTCVSPGMAEHMQQFTPRTIEVVPNFYNKEVFVIDPNQKKYDKFTWVSIGEPAHTKGLDTLFYAFAELKVRMHNQPMQLILIDEIPEKVNLISLARSLHIEDDLVWKGLMSQESVAHELQKSHSLVSASRVESFGKTIIEALGCGLPVVATKTDGAKYIVDLPKLGELASIGNAESLVTAMQKIMVQYDEYNSQEISDLIGARFGQTKIIGQWIELYNNLVS